MFKKIILIEDGEKPHGFFTEKEYYFSTGIGNRDVKNYTMEVGNYKGWIGKNSFQIISQ